MDLLTLSIMQGRLGVVSVRSFGAKGDGVTDDHEAIQRAISSVSGGGQRKCLYFPQGTYLLGQSIDVDVSKIAALIGAGDSTVVVDSPDGIGFRLVGTHAGTANPSDPDTQRIKYTEMGVLVAGLRIVGTTFATVGIEARQVFGLSIDGCYFADMGTGVRLTERMRNTIITDSHFWNCDIGIHWDQVNSHQQIIEGCHFTTSVNGGSHALLFDGGDVHNVQITGCGIEGYGQCGELIKIHAYGNKSQISQVAINGCSIETHMGNARPLIGLGATREGGDEADVIIVQINGNEFSGSSQPAIGVFGATEGVSVTGNVFWGIDNWAITIEEGGIASDWNVTGNSFGVTRKTQRRMGLVYVDQAGRIEHFIFSSNVANHITRGAVKIEAQVENSYQIVFANNDISFAAAYSGWPEIPQQEGFAFDLNFGSRQAWAVRIQGNNLRIRDYVEHGMRLTASAYEKCIIADNTIRGEGYGDPFIAYDLPSPESGNVVVRDNI